MTQPIVKLYQSGEKVPESGQYEVVGASLPQDRRGLYHTVYTLRVGEVFPGYKGRTVCWYWKYSDSNTDELVKASLVEM